MNTTFRSIFFNPSLNYLRAGWRIGIFLLIAVGCNTVITGPVVALLQQQFPAMDKQIWPAYIFYGVTTLATWIMLRFVDKRPFVSVGVTFRGNWGKELTQGLLFGFGMMSAIYGIESMFGMVVIEWRELPLSEAGKIFLNSAALYLVVGYGEEVLFRGYLFQTFVEGTNKVIATVLLSLLFAVAHGNNPNVSLFGLINVGLAGIWLSIAYFKTKALWLPIGLHISWNFTQGFVYAYPVSGTTSTGTQIGTAVVSGPEWLTGGSFGPEGGALATLMLIAGTLLIVFWKWVSASDTAWSYEQWRSERLSMLQPPPESVPAPTGQ